MITQKLRGSFIKVTASILSFLMLLSAPATAFAAEADKYCWKNSQVRGAGTIPSDCDYSQEKQGLLCYSKCPAGSVGNGPVCWQSCPAGFVDNGVGCTKPAPYARGGGYPWQIQDGLNNAGMLARCQSGEGSSCEMWGAIAYPTCKSGFSAFGSNICSPTCPTGYTDVGVSCLKPTTTRPPITAKCAAGTVYEDGLCYSACPAGYAGVGPVCWGVCPVDKPLECGAGCAADMDTCGLQTTDQVLSVFSFVTDVAVTVVTAGGYAGIKAGAKQAIKQGTKALSKGITKEVVKQGFETLAKEGRTFIKEQVKAKAEEIIILQVQNGITTTIDPNAEVQEADFEWTDLDPTGIGDIVKAYNHPICSPPPAGTVVPGPAPTDFIPIPNPNRKGVFTRVAGAATDIAVTNNGTAFVIGTGSTGDNPIWTMRPQDSGWTAVSGSGVRIAANGKTLAVVNSLGGIWRSVDAGKNWTNLPGWASDVAVDANDNIFVVGKAGSIWELKSGESIWRALPNVARNTNNVIDGPAVRITAAGSEQVAVVAGKGKWTYVLDTANLANPWRGASSTQDPRSDIAMSPAGTVLEAFSNGGVAGTSKGTITSGDLKPQSVAIGGAWMWAVGQDGGIFKAKF